MKKSFEVFRVEKPFAGSLNKAIIYNKDRSFYGEIDFNPDLQKFLGDKEFAYAFGYVDKDGILRVSHEVETNW